MKNLHKLLILSLIVTFNFITIYETLAQDKDQASITQYKKIYDIGKQLKCLVCSGESISESSSDFAIRIRALIAAQIKLNMTPEEIKHRIISTYGAEISLEPRLSFSTAILWLLPLCLLISTLFMLLYNYNFHNYLKSKINKRKNSQNCSIMDKL